MTRTLPDGPTTQPWRSMVRWMREPLPMLEDLSARHGTAFSIKVPRLPQPMVFFSDPAAVKQIWSGDPEELRAGEANVILKSVLGGNSLLLLDGARHLRERRLMLPPFHGERMKAYGTAMRDATQRELERWPIGKTISFAESMQSITLEVIMRTIFGVGEEAKLAPLREALVRWTTLGTSRIGTAMLLLVPPDQAERIQRFARSGLGKLLPWAPLVSAQQETDRLVRELIAARRREDTTGREDVLSMLLEARDERGQRMTDDELRDEMLTMLVAGHETTATTLAWTIHHLLEHPAWLAKVRAQLSEVVGDRPVEPEDLERLTLLDATIKETLRLTPIIPLVGRRVAKPMTIGGYDLPVGAIAMACIYLVHRRADLWRDPQTFDPTRFVGAKIDPTHYFPFGGGTRRCLGMAFANYEMKVVLATILSRVQLGAAPGTRIKLVRRGITLAPSDGMPVVVTRREA